MGGGAQEAGLELERGFYAAGLGQVGGAGGAPGRKAGPPEAKAGAAEATVVGRMPRPTALSVVPVGPQFASSS